MESMTTALATLGTKPFAQGSAKVLVIAGSEGSSDIVEALGRCGHQVETRSALDEEALGQTGSFDIVFVDGPMLETARQLCDGLGTPVVAMSEVDSVILGAGGGDASSPATGTTMSLMVDLLLERAFMQQRFEEMQQRCDELETLVAGVRDGSSFVGTSPVMRRLNGALSRAAGGDATVLIEGAAGSGKSLAARVIHCQSKRGNRPLMVRQGAELDGETFQSVVEEARGTTLLIEDVEQMPSAGQQSLVRFIKDRSRHGNSDDAPRLIVTTGAQLPELVARGAFREDLYYRLHNYPLVVPALRERKEDIAQLATTLLDQVSAGRAGRGAGYTNAALELLRSMDWPRNVTQLENTIRRAWLAAAGGPIDVEHVQEEAQTSVTVPTTAGAPAQQTESRPLTEADIRSFEDEEKEILQRALKATGKVRRAAELLGIGRATLYRKIQQHDLKLA
jgi:DNA-binding NtrC family response regulator